MTIREREPRFRLLRFPIGSKIGKEIETGGMRVRVAGPESEDDLEGPWRGYYVEVIDPDTVFKGKIVNIIRKKKTTDIKSLVLLPPIQNLHRDEINQDPITRKMVCWEP